MEKYRPDRIQDVAQQAVLNSCTCDEALGSTEVYVPRFGRGHGWCTRVNQSALGTVQEVYN